MEGREAVITFSLVSALAALGFGAGLARAWLPRAAGLAVAAIVIGYLALLAVTAGWVAACSGCASHISYDSARWLDLYAAIFWGGLFTAGIVLSVSVGSLVSTALRRLFR